MANFCLTLPQVNDFKAKLADGSIDPEKLSGMSSEDRHAFLAGIVGKENAREVNALFESRLLLKNQKDAMVLWAKKVAGLSEPARKDIFSKIEKLDRVLNPTEGEHFLNDLAATKLGMGVTEKEAKTIAELSKSISTASTALDKGGVSEMGRAKVALENYVNNLKPEEGGFKNKLAHFFSIQRAIQTGFDISSALRQGIAYFGRKEWFGAVYRGFKYAGSEQALNEFKAKVYSDPLWDTVNKYKDKLGLTVFGQTFSTREEQFASKLIGKIPGLKNSERFYEGMLNDLRYHRFVNTIQAAEKAGRPMSEQAKESLAKVISSSTGRGDLSRYGLESAAKNLSTAFFAPKNAVSKIDVILDPVLRKGARIEAAKNLATLAGLSFGTLGLLKAAGVGIEVDPRSSDFGKASFGSTKVDLTFGFGSYIRLFAQLASNSTKSTTTGQINDLNTGEFGSKTSFDVLSRFAKGKFSPGASLVIDFLNRSDYDGNKLGIDFKNIGAEKNKNSLERIFSMFEPLLVSDTLDAFKSASGQENDIIPKDFSNAGAVKTGLAAGALSFVGIGVNTNRSKRADTQKILDIPSNDANFKPLLDRMTKENVGVTLPSTTTEIKPPGSLESRVMTKPELETYQQIYQKNLKQALDKSKTGLLTLPTTKAFTGQLDKIKRDTTDRSKLELLKGMIK